MPAAVARSVTACALLAVAACAPQVRLQTAPDLLSSRWRDADVPAAAHLPSSLGEALGSEELARLISTARAANPDLGAAAARVAQARAQLRVARADMLPVVGASAGVSGRRDSRVNSGLFDFSQGFAGLDVAFDFDLFGGAASSRRAARARYGAAELERQATALVIEAEVARALVQHAALSERVSLLDRNIEQAAELLRIIEVRHRAGDASRVDTGLQTIQLRQLQVERHRLLEARDRTRSALALLVGLEAPLFEVPGVMFEDFTVPAIGVVQPADLLVRRPDVRSREYLIRAAEGDVGAARAAFLPRLRIAAAGAGEVASLGGPIATVVTAGLSLLAPIFDRPRLQGELEFATARQAETVELYRRSLLTALAEAEDGLAAVQHSAAREALLEQIVAEARTTARLARLQYVEGAADLQWVLDAEQLLVQAEDARVVARQERLEAAIDLFRAMGGQPNPPSIPVEDLI